MIENLSSSAFGKDRHINSLRSIYDDLRDRLVEDLERGGLSVPDTARKNVASALCARLRVAHRSITPRPRILHWSTELQARRVTLASELQALLSLVANELEKGDDVNQRLTRHYFRAGFNDPLLNDLGVHHLHLGRRDDGHDKTRRHIMSGGGDELLWVTIQPRDVYLLELLPHHAFNTFDFARVIHRNWKFLLGSPLEGCSIDEATIRTAEQRATLRNAGFSTPLSIDGEVFFTSLIMSDGTSVEVARRADAMLNGVRELYEWIEANFASMLTRMEGREPSELHFTVGDLDAFVLGNISLVDQKSGLVVLP